MATRYSYVLGGNDGRFDPFTSGTTGWTLPFVPQWMRQLRPII
jgi:hypothetical protein